MELITFTVLQRNTCVTYQNYDLSFVMLEFKTFF